VATDLTGVSARAMLEALVMGERGPKVLADLAKRTLRHKILALIEALEGRFKLLPALGGGGPVTLLGGLVGGQVEPGRGHRSLLPVAGWVIQRAHRSCRLGGRPPAEIAQGRQLLAMIESRMTPRMSLGSVTR
jgi:hypothetical protein